MFRLRRGYFREGIRTMPLAKSVNIWSVGTVWKTWILRFMVTRSDGGSVRTVERRIAGDTVFWFLLWVVWQAGRFSLKLIWWLYLLLQVLAYAFAYLHEGAHMLACWILRVPHSFEGYNKSREQFSVSYEAPLWRASLINLAPLVLVIPAFLCFQIFYSLESEIQWLFLLLGLGFGFSCLPSYPDTTVLLDVHPFRPISSFLALLHLPFFLLQLPSLVSSEYPHALKIVAGFFIYAVASPVSIRSVLSITYGVPW